MSRPPAICVCGQTPPPLHGQAVLIRALLDGRYSRIRLVPVRMAFSARLEEVGRFSVRKGFHLAGLAVRLAAARLFRRAAVLYYPPAGPGRAPLWRDILLLLLVRPLFRKTVYHFHAAGLAASYAALSPFAKWLFRRAYGRPDAVLYLSGHSPDDAAPLRPRVRRVVPNGVADATDGRPPARECAPDVVPTILYVGALSRDKGILLLLEAAGALRARSIPFRVVLVGEWRSEPFRTEALAAVRRLGLENHIVWPGRLEGEAKWRVFSEADLFAFPSRTDTFPLALVEAMMMGLPAVASDLYGMKDLVTEGETGFRTPVDDAAALADRLERLLADPALRRRQGAAARARYEREFTLDVWRARMEAILAEVAAS